MGAKKKVIKTSFVKFKTNTLKKKVARRGYAKGGGGKGAAQSAAPAPVSVMKKVNWMNREGLFGQELVDEGALEMLGSLPAERGMSILENMEAKAHAGEIWNPNSYIVKAVVRHGKGMQTTPMQTSAPAPTPVLKKVNWMNRVGMFAGKGKGKSQVDEDAIEMLGSLPTERAMSILENMELKAEAGEIWNPNSYVVKATIRHSGELEARARESKGGQAWGKGASKGKGKGNKGKGRGKGSVSKPVYKLVYKPVYKTSKTKGMSKGQRGKGRNKPKGRAKGKFLDR